MAAVHEAGHCIVAGALALDIHSATITSGPEPLGPARVEIVEHDGEPLASRAMTRLAGRQALVGFGMIDKPGAEIGCRADLDEARAYAIALTDGDGARANALLDEWRAKVDEIIFEHRGPLGEVVVALIERGTLDAAEIAELVGVTP